MKIIDQSRKLTIQNKWISKNSNAIWVDVDCECGDKRDKTSMMLEYWIEDKEMSLRFYHTLHYTEKDWYSSSDTWKDTAIKKFKCYRLRFISAIKVLFTGYLEVECETDIYGEKRILDLIQLLQEAVDWSKEEKTLEIEKLAEMERKLKNES